MHTYKHKQERGEKGNRVNFELVDFAGKRGWSNENLPKNIDCTKLKKASIKVKIFCQNKEWKGRRLKK